MSILGSIISKIFHASTQVTTAIPSAQSNSQASAAPQTVSPANPAPVVDAPRTMPPTAPLQQVDVHAVLTQMAAQHGEKLNWEQSIVDLLKLVGLDSSLEARKELAKELNYTGDTGDSATMNIWLHKQVTQKLAENGGKLPDSLKAA